MGYVIYIIWRWYVFFKWLVMKIKIYRIMHKRKSGLLNQGEDLNRSKMLSKSEQDRLNELDKKLDDILKE